jgi:aminopeptidase N
MNPAGAFRVAFALLSGIVAGCASVSLHTGVETNAGAFDVLHYDVRLEPDLAGKTVRGEAVVRVSARHAGLAEITLDGDGLVIDAATAGSTPLAVSQEARAVTLALPQPLRNGETLALHLRYHAAPRFGLQFHPERTQLYTIFSTSQWLPSIDRPHERASLDLRVVVPPGLVAVGNGELVARTTLADGREEFHWRQRRPIPGYVMGFAAGRFRTTTQRAGATTLRFLGDGYDDGELQRVFGETAGMLRYFARRAGVAYPDRTYTQALVAETIGQELAGFSLLSDAYARRVLADPSATGLIAHEAAHQWWGNSVTCADWTHFWLNEGLVTFMTATWQEQRYGADTYARLVDGWRRRHAELVAAGRDKPLVFPDWNAPSADDRAVVYQKGALALHELRAELGEAAFWRGIARYTKRHFGRAVVTADFQAAMERASGRDLSAFFARWAYGAP